MVTQHWNGNSRGGYKMTNCPEIVLLLIFPSLRVFLLSTHLWLNPYRFRFLLQAWSLTIPPLYGNQKDNLGVHLQILSADFQLHIFPTLHIHILDSLFVDNMTLYNPSKLILQGGSLNSDVRLRVLQVYKYHHCTDAELDQCHQIWGP